MSTLHLTGCATPSDFNAMTYIPQESNICHSSLKRDISVGEVSGGYASINTSQISNDDFKKALENSLLIAGLKTQPANANYRLNAKMIKLKQPLIGIDATVSYTVNYILISKHNNIIYNKNISSSYTAKFSEALMAAERLRLANEGAARENIKKLIDDLCKLQ
jgi:hypothetical protein